MAATIAQDVGSQYRAQTVQDLRAPMLRRLALATFFVAWAGAVISPQPTLRPDLALCLSAMAVALGSLGLLRRSYAAGGALYVAGLATLAVAAALLHPEWPLAPFLSLIVATAVLLFDPRAGALMAGVITAALAAAVRSLHLAAPAGAVEGLVLVWLTFGVVWQGAQPMTTLVSWSWQSYVEARERAVELQNRQARLNQLLKDLDAAYNELANASRRLAFSKALAEEARRAKAEFVANVSHELRTPINMIIGFTEMIVRAPSSYARGGLPPALLADLDVVLRNARHLSDLINDILDLSQLDVGRMGLVKEWTSMAGIAEAAVAAIAPLARMRGLPVELDVDEGLPPVYVDRTRIRQVLLNLLSNAVRFTEQGGIRVSVRRHDDHIVAAVSDTGPGIAAEDLPKLFEPFRQLDGSLRRQYGGTGLGLHISRSFVALHGGEMGIDSQLGQGTTIRFSLPIEDTVPFSPLQRSPASPDRGPATSAAYVVVEPEPVIEGLLRRYLEGGRVVRAASVAEAAKLSRSQPTLAIALRATHAREAWELLQRAGQTDLSAPLIACSMPGAVEAYSEELGLAGYLLKPVTRQRLLSALEALPEARTVLIVDDDPDFLRLFARMLRSARRRYTVWQATSAGEALALLDGRRPDVIFLDVLLPDLEGPLLLNRIRAREALRDIPVFFVTACDAAGSPLVASFVGVSHRGGLSADELMRCIRALGQTLSGAIPPAERELPADLPG